MVVLQRVAALLHDRQIFAKRKAGALLLGERMRDLASGGAGRKYTADDDRLLLYVSSLLAGGGLAWCTQLTDIREWRTG